MKITFQIQLIPDAAAEARLRETVERFNEACNWLSRVSFDRKVTKTYDLHKIAYRDIREKFGLPADTTKRCLARVSVACSTNKTTVSKFKKHAAVPFGMRKNIGFKGNNNVSISTLNGRVVIPFVMGEHQAKLFPLRKGQSDLIFRRDGRWFLSVSVEVPEPPVSQPTDFIGVDMGVVNIAVDSDGNSHNSNLVEEKRLNYLGRRRAISRKAEGASRRSRRSCHKAILKIGQKESRCRTDVNHQISKKLVQNAQDTCRGIAIEDLRGIRERAPFPKRQRARMGSWAFSQLRLFIDYKARRSGVRLVLVDPRNTSRTCNECGHCEKGNRKNQSEFKCLSCGHETHADLNAARNIRARAVANMPMAAESLAVDG